MRQIRSALGAALVDSALLTAAERLQFAGYLRREEINAAIAAQAEHGAARSCALCVDNSFETGDFPTPKKQKPAEEAGFTRSKRLLGNLVSRQH